VRDPLVLPLPFVEDALVLPLLPSDVVSVDFGTVLVVPAVRVEQERGQTLVLLEQHQLEVDSLDDCFLVFEALALFPLAEEEVEIVCDQFGRAGIGGVRVLVQQFLEFGTCFFARILDLFHNLRDHCVVLLARSHGTESPQLVALLTFESFDILLESLPPVKILEQIQGHFVYQEIVYSVDVFVLILNLFHEDFVALVVCHFEVEIYIEGDHDIITFVLEVSIHIVHLFVDDVLNRISKLNQIYIVVHDFHHFFFK